jgi:hypothetical protein
MYRRPVKDRASLVASELMRPVLEAPRLGLQRKMGGSTWATTMALGLASQEKQAGSGRSQVYFRKSSAVLRGKWLRQVKTLKR